MPPYKIWGWIPIPGHFEPRLGWYNINFERTIRIPHYQPPRKVTYYTYEKVYDFNLYKAKTVVGGVVSTVALGTAMIAVGVSAVPSGGSSVAAVIGAGGTVWGVLGGGIFDAWNAGDETSWISEDYGSQLHHITGL